MPALAGNTEEAGRRRERRHGASDEQLQPVRRRSLGAIVQLLLGVCCWVAVGEVVYVTDPADPLARIAFFGAFFGALFFTLAPLLRGLTLHLSRSRLYQEASGRHAARQALLLAAFVILNAGMQAMRSWSALNALLLLGAFAVIEVVALARR